MSSDLNNYTVTLADIPHTMQLDERMAALYGPLAVRDAEPREGSEPVKGKSVTNPANKSRSTSNK